MKSKLLIILLSFSSVHLSAQNNLLDSSTWTVGSGSVTGFTKSGSDAENVREFGANPYGNAAVLWKSVPDGDNHADGGWDGSYHNIDNTRSYRFTVWIKKLNSNNGTTYFGLRSRTDSNTYTTLMLDGTQRDNSYFWTGDLPVLNKWYLAVGFIHGNSHTATSSIGGLYDPVTGNKVQNSIDYKFRSDATRIMHRAYLYYDTNTSDTQFFFGPTIYEVNGQEPTIADIIASNPVNSSGETVWSSNDSGINYMDGNVGIGTNNPNSKLNVIGGELGQAANDKSIISSMEGKVYNFSKFQVLNKRNSNGSDWLNTSLRLQRTVDATEMAFIDFGIEGKSGNYGLAFGTRNGFSGTQQTRMVVEANGNVGIGTTSPDSKLAVNGNIHAKEVKVDLIGWPDYVFEENYDLPSLEEVEKHIKEKGHLINIPSAKEVAENGIELGEMNKLLLEKIEELTLYVIQQQKEIEELKNQKQ